MTQDTSIDMPRLEALLPGYVNSSASPADRLFVKQALALSAQARAALAWHEALAQKVIHDVNAIPPDLGWTQLQARVHVARHAEKLGKPLVAARRNNGLQRVAQFLLPYMPHNWLPAPALGGACALLLAIVAGQGYLLVENAADETYGQARGSQPVGTGTGTELPLPGQSKYVQLNFKEAVSERDMRLLLVRTGAVIVNGPGQLGDYTVAVPSKEVESALTQFRESLLTESARVVDFPASLSAKQSGSTGAAPGQAKP